MAITVRELLFEKYKQYLDQAGERRRLKEFAAKIGMGQAYLNQLMNGKRSPGEKTVELLANYFKDLRFYDAIGKPRPDPILIYISRNWGSAPDQLKRKIAEDIRQYTTEPIPDEKNDTASNKN